MLPVENLQELQKILAFFNIDFSNSFKGSKDLWKEIQNGECELVIEGDKLIRKVTVVNIIVRCGDQQLYETKQVKKDGSVRERNLPYLAEKLSPSETLKEGILRALKEELSLENIPPESGIKSIYKVDSEAPPSSYAGLESQYTVYQAVYQLPEELYNPKGYMEQQSKKTVYFEWRSVQ